MAGAYFYVQTRYLVSDQKPEDTPIHLSLAAFIPEAIPPAEKPEEIEKEEPVVEEETIIEPEPEPVIEEKPLPEKIIPEPVKPKIIPKPKPVLKKKTVKKKKVKKKVSRKVPPKTTKGMRQTGSAKKNNSTRKSQFLAEVRRKINQHKSYPKIAKRRGMQGIVRVRFTILANGNVGNISVSGPKVFHRSARRAVQSAFPVSTKNVPVSLPKRVNLTLRYQLK